MSMGVGDQGMADDKIFRKRYSKNCVYCIPKSPRVKR